MEYIYVVLVKALTGLGKTARFFSKYDYTHIAVCLDENISDFITFSRRKHYAPFDCGFMHETLDCYTFGKNKKVKLKVFKIPVLENDKKEIECFIASVASDKEYLFNFYSMLTMPVFHGFEIYKTYNCMSFVSKIIELSNAVIMNKQYYKYNISEIDALLNSFLYKEEYFSKQKEEAKDYMQHVCIFKNIYSFLKLNAKLLYRLLLKRNQKF